MERDCDTIAVFLLRIMHGRLHLQPTAAAAAGRSGVQCEIFDYKATASLVCILAVASQPVTERARSKQIN